MTDQHSNAVYAGILRCKRCGERTTVNRESSFYGNVHQYGPTSHRFVARLATAEEAQADKEQGL